MRLLSRARGTLIGATVLLVGTVVVPVAHAAVPVNDTLAGRLTLTVPSLVELDTSQATVGALDAVVNAECGAPATTASVWFQVTPARGGGLVVDVEKSNYPAGAIVLSGRRGAWQLETCGPAVVAWEARAGVRYVIMALDDQSDGGGNGGLLILNLRRLPPPPTIDVTVDPVGSFDPRSGAAVITGRVTCTGQSDYTELSITVTQRVGRLLIRGWGWSQVDCSGENLRWLIPVTADNGLFKGGHAATVTTGFTCGPFTCSEGYDETVVQLRR